MVTFVCEACQESLKKQKLDQHTYRCRYAQFTCVDCSKTFQGTEYRAHTSCISEAEKYQKALFKPKKGQQQKQQNTNNNNNNDQVKPAPDAPANVSAAPKSAPLISQIKKTEEVKKPAESKRPRDESESSESESEKEITQKSKKSKKEDVKASPKEKAAENGSEADLKVGKAMKAVVKKNGEISLAKFRQLVVKKVQKKSPKATAEAILAKLDETVVLITDGEKTSLKF
ncbi:hypothetical protein HDV05_004370 [Chytridiales sp. JEL 0842]|nr:hypothetical protein HDV05_004370 [Chytridiales sp. JEL 0842]